MEDPTHHFYYKYTARDQIMFILNAACMSFMIKTEFYTRAMEGEDVMLVLRYMYYVLCIMYHKAIKDRSQD